MNRNSHVAEILTHVDLLNILSSKAPQPREESSTQSLYNGFLLRAFERRPTSSQDGSSQSSSTSSALADLAHASSIETRRGLQRQSPRRWSAGQIYAPHDLSSVEASKYAVMRRRPQRDVFDLLGSNPLKHYKNFALLSQFVTETGRIKSAKDTGLRPVNQRKLAKAIRRAVGLGLMPSVYKHPEVLGKLVGLNRETGR